MAQLDLTGFDKGSLWVEEGKLHCLRLADVRRLLEVGLQLLTEDLASTMPVFIVSRRNLVKQRLTLRSELE